MREQFKWSEGESELKLVHGLLIGVFLSLLGCSHNETGVAYAKLTQGTSPTLTPVPRLDKEWWIARHNDIVSRVKQGDVNIIMVGDSITQRWETDGKQIWDKYYGSRNAVNMGFSGDKVQNVLWRISNGEITGISPKLAIVMIGTNNSKTDNATDVADGIIAICQKLRADLPKTKIILLAIFPRGQTPQNRGRIINEDVNKIIAKLADNKHIYFLDINKEFLQKDGSIPESIMPDKLHVNGKGYIIWAKAMEPLVSQLLKSTPIND